MRLVLLGPPGAGKGTLAALLKKSLHVPHISTGDILREEMKNMTPLGSEVKKFIEEGRLVPDEMVTKLVENRILTDKKLSNGYLLDGFPRTYKQAQDLDKILTKISQPLHYVLYMEATLPVIINRLTGRRVCKSCGFVCHVINRPSKIEGICDVCAGTLYQRADDNEQAIKTRMDEYLKNTTPIADFYEAQGILKKINADKESEEVHEILMRVFNEEGRKQYQH
jgi:adenylate kinase